MGRTIRDIKWTLECCCLSPVLGRGRFMLRASKRFFHFAFCHFILIYCNNKALLETHCCCRFIWFSRTWYCSGGASLPSNKAHLVMVHVQQTFRSGVSSYALKAWVLFHKRSYDVLVLWYGIVNDSYSRLYVTLNAMSNNIYKLNIICYIHKLTLFLFFRSSSFSLVL